MVYCLGESLYDIVFKNYQPAWSVAGGGMLNASVSLGRSLVDVSLITELGNDAVGDIICSFLKENNVSIDYIVRSSGNTTVALAFLDEYGNSTYQFYNDRSEAAPIYSIPDFKQGDVLMFGSVYSILPRNRRNILRLSREAIAKGAIIYYDPNYRSAYSGILNEVLPHIRENISLANIVRGSDEDFKIICGSGNHADAYKFVADAGCDNLIVTRNMSGAVLYSGNDIKFYDALPAEIVSTIGAGDSFNAGMVFSIDKLKHIPAHIHEWDECINTALSFAAKVCAKKENYI